MEIIAQAKYIKISPRKVRVVAEAVKKLSPELALSHLALMPKRASGPIAKVLKSALANAKNKQSLRPGGLNKKLSADMLTIKSIVVGSGPASKRWRPVSRGRAHPYKKRTSHIRVVLTDENSGKQMLALTDKAQAESKEEMEKGEKHGTKS